MAFDTDRLSTLVGNMIAMLPVTATIGGASYTGARTVLSDRRRQELYGVGADIQYSIIFKAADFTTVPAIGTEVTIDGDTLRVIGRDYDSGRVSVRLDMGEEYVR